MEAMQHIATINSLYYCERPKVNGPVIVFTTGAYRVAEFDEHTGIFHWHRVVPAPQKTIIENWFSLRFAQTATAEPSEEPKKLARQARA
jgi:hypothetical protein